MKNEHCRASLCSYRTRSETNKRISVSILGAAVSIPFTLKRKGSGTYNKRFRINAVMRSDEIAHGIRYSDADGILTVMQIRCKLERIVKPQRSGVPAVNRNTGKSISAVKAQHSRLALVPCIAAFRRYGTAVKRISVAGYIRQQYCVTLLGKGKITVRKQSFSLTLLISAVRMISVLPGCALFPMG
mgnify:CR=1 FL=1